MIDASTLAAYDAKAASYATDWHEQPAPIDLHELVRQHFHPGPTADIGCGSGRDSAWLAAQGFDVIGFDASAGLLQEARNRYPQLRFEQSVLPALEGLASGNFVNVLCETVIMHLDVTQIGAAVRRLVDLLRPEGTLYLSWRVTEGSDQRDANGRLYTAFDPALVLEALSATTILVDEQKLSASSGKTIRCVVASK